MKDDITTYEYIFTFPTGKQKSFKIALNGVSLSTNTCPVSPPQWARLEHHQCTPCSLSTKVHTSCPAALAISSLVTTFQGTVSHKSCVVSCVSEDRTVTKETTVQEGLASILGLLMATSGCPIMNFFRPLARFHLPFSTVDETIFRVFTTYMLRQYYRQSEGQNCGFELKDIRNQYALVKQVNKGMLERIRDIAQFDADKNAIVTLDSLAQILEMEIDTNLESLQYLFTTDI